MFFFILHYTAVFPFSFFVCCNCCKLIIHLAGVVISIVVQHRSKCCCHLLVSVDIRMRRLFTQLTHPLSITCLLLLYGDHFFQFLLCNLSRPLLFMRINLQILIYVPLLLYWLNSCLSPRKKAEKTSISIDHLLLEWQL